jgi:hypothetical protein
MGQLTFIVPRSHPLMDTCAAYYTPKLEVRWPHPILEEVEEGGPNWATLATFWTVLFSENR